MIAHQGLSSSDTSVCGSYQIMSVQSADPWRCIVPSSFKSWYKKFKNQNIYVDQGLILFSSEFPTGWKNMGLSLCQKYYDKLSTKKPKGSNCWNI